MNKLFEIRKTANKDKVLYFKKYKLFTVKKHKVSYPSLTAMQNIQNPVEYIKSLGVSVGENTRFIIYPYFFSYPEFGSEPYLISIGKDCLISYGVAFITHDGSMSVCQKLTTSDKRVYKLGRISIGDNCFIGCHSLIMPGVNIGNNSIVAAGSVVTKNIPEGEVWGGNPARFIKTTKDLISKVEKTSETPEQKELLEIVLKHNEEMLKELNKK